MGVFRSCYGEAGAADRWGGRTLEKDGGARFASERGEDGESGGAKGTQIDSMQQDAVGREMVKFGG